MTSQNLQPTHNAVYILQSSSRWRHDHNSQLSFTNIAQPYIPISTAAPRTLRNTHTFLYFFQTSNFQKIFGPFPGTPGAFAHHFWILLLPLHTLNFLPTFRPLFSLPSSRYCLPSTSWSSQYLLQVQSPRLAIPRVLLLLGIFYICVTYMKPRGTLRY